MGSHFWNKLRASTKSSYPANRNRVKGHKQRSHHPATVNPPSDYGAYDPQPMPASVYQANGLAVDPAAATAAATAAASYGAFPDNSAPVQATAYMPGQGEAVVASVPVQATAYMPGTAPAAAQNIAPVQASIYDPNSPAVAAIPAATAYGATAPPATNPLYSNQQPSFINNGNCNYKCDESSFWECVICTFPNLRSEANCKGCGSACPPGKLYSAASAAAASAQMAQHQPPQSPHQPPQSPMNATNSMNNQMNNLSMGGADPRRSSLTPGGTSGVMRVHIPTGMQPGQKIKVRSPDGLEQVKTIPPMSEWDSDDNRKPFFRMEFGPSAGPVAHGALVAPGVTSPHNTAWRDFYTTASPHLPKAPLGTKSIPYSPRGGAGIPPNGRHKSLIIGINYYRSRAELRGCINDAKNMQSLLQRNGFPNDGSHMLLLTDERTRGKEHQPTLQNIMKAFAWFMKDVRRGDVLFFHFSGHGGQTPDKTGHEVDGYNETLIPVDYQRNGQITDDVLWGGLVYKLPEGARITALMDMCHSGTGLDLPFDYNVNTGQWKQDINPAHSAGDVVLFSGCEDQQTSADVSGGYGQMAGGAMTQAFMKAYETTAPNSTYHDFLDGVKRHLRKKRFKQRPQLTSSQQFDTRTRIFSLGYQSPSGGGPSVIEPNHNPKVGRIKTRHVRPAREGFGGGGGGGGASNLFGLVGAVMGGALVADALF